MTSQVLSSSLDIPAESLDAPASTKPASSFWRRLVGSVIEGRQHKAALEMVEYLARHPEYRDRYHELQSPMRGR
jgi:GrpB-like predicted nucleotidyltransferase (UPF0157 family)